MKYVKIIKDLFEKASEREDGMASINGRVRYYNGVQGDLESKYKIAFTSDHVSLEHWGTEIIAIDTTKETVENWYGEGVSDRDAINMLLYLLNMDDRFRAIYRPSGIGFKVARLEHTSVGLVSKPLK